MSADFWLPHFDLYNCDKQLIRNYKGWLHGAIINVAQDILKHKFPHIDGFQNCLLGQNLTLSTMTRECVQILHDGVSHWFCVSTFGCEEGEAIVYDSIRMMEKDPFQPLIFQQIACFLNCNTSTLTLNYANVCYQKRSHDCGVYAIAFAASVCHGKDPTLIKYNQSKMRKHLIQCLQNGNITEFPSKSRRRRGKKVKTTKVIKLCYHPRLSEAEYMIRCSDCGVWYHEGCTRNQTVLLHKSIEKWSCQSCFTNIK